MPDTTPGQICYEAFWQTYAAVLGTHGTDPWDALHPGTQQSWEAAAQAVLEDGEGAPRFLFALGAVLRLATATRPHTVRSRRWVEREVMPPYAEYSFVAADGTVFWEVEADLVPWEDDPHA